MRRLVYTNRPPQLTRAELKPLAEAHLSRPEIAKALSRSESHVDKRLRALGLATTGGDVRREREWLADGFLVIREPVGESARWTNAARSWEGDPMSSPYLEALLACGFLEKAESVHVETYRLAGKE